MAKLRDRGYFPMAVLNYVISAGGGFRHQQYAKPTIHNMKELVEKVLIRNYFPFKSNYFWL